MSHEKGQTVNDTEGGQSDGICHIFMQTTITNWDANQRIQIKHTKNQTKNR